MFDNNNSKMVSAFVFNPDNSIFSDLKNKHAYCEMIKCSLPECPLRAEGSCINRNIISSNCPYGRNFKDEGPTRKARSFYKWVSEKQKIIEGVPMLTNPVNKLRFIGDYVYLPYSFMDNNKEIPFLRHSHAFSFGQPFLKKEFWTLETVEKILNFKPQALMGGEIKDYQTESVPKFLSHLREEDKSMWDKLVQKRPQLDKTPSYIGRKAYLWTVKFPISFTVASKEGKYPVHWTWDGVHLSTESKNAYSNCWGNIPLNSVEIKGVPHESSVIEIKDDSWVLETTKFMD